MIQIYGRELYTYIYLSWRIMVYMDLVQLVFWALRRILPFLVLILFPRIAKEKIETCRKWKHLLLMHAFVDTHRIFYLSTEIEQQTLRVRSLNSFFYQVRVFLINFLEEFTGSGLVYTQKNSVDHDVWKTVRCPVRISVWITFEC